MVQRVLHGYESLILLVTPCMYVLTFKGHLLYETWPCVKSVLQYILGGRDGPWGVERGRGLGDSSNRQER